MKYLVTLIALLVLSGCATFDYCDLTSEKRCALEAKLNDRLDDIGSDARIAFQCPDAELCPLPRPGGDESGDFTVVIIEP